jgi:hypothetical protein
MPKPNKRGKSGSPLDGIGRNLEDSLRMLRGHLPGVGTAKPTVKKAKAKYGHAKEDSKSIPYVSSTDIPSTRYSVRARKDGLILKAEEVFHEIDATAQFTSRPFGLNPTNVLLFPTAQTLALAFTKAKMRRVEIHYHATASAIQTGRIALAYINDPKRNQPSDIRELLAYEGAEVGACYRDLHLKAKVDTEYEYYLPTFTGQADTQLRFEMPGYIDIVTDETVSGEVGYPIGVVSVSYEIEFYDMRGPQQLVGNFYKSEDQGVDDGYVTGSTFYQNLTTPDSNAVVGYFGHSEPQPNASGSANLWNAFESVVTDAGKWLFNSGLDYLIDLVALDSPREEAEWQRLSGCQTVVVSDQKTETRTCRLSDDKCYWSTSLHSDDLDSKIDLIESFIEAREAAAISLGKQVREFRNSFSVPQIDEKVDTAGLSQHWKVFSDPRSPVYSEYGRICAAVSHFRELWTPFDESWCASRGALRRFLRSSFGLTASTLALFPPSTQRSIVGQVVTIPNGVPTYLGRQSHLLFVAGPLVEVNMTATYYCNMPSGSQEALKSQVVSSTEGVRETVLLRLETSVDQGCRVGIICTCPDTHTIVLRAASGTEQAATNDTSSDVDGCTFNVSTLELSEVAIDFRSA